MSPQLSSILATMMVVSGGAAVLIMLELTGKVQDNHEKKFWVLAHRLLGYLFIALFGTILVIMVKKASGYSEEMSARAIIHIVLALLLLPLLLIKILSARRYAQFTTKLFLLGSLILGISFSMLGISAGHYVMNRSSFQYTILPDADKVVLNAELGLNLMKEKCNKCHSLERAYQQYKTKIEWTETVNKMAERDAPNITPFDVQQIVGYLVHQQEQQDAMKGAELERGKKLVARKCNICHPLERVFRAVKKRPAWEATVNRMMRTMDDSNFLSAQEKNDIVGFLSNRHRGNP